MHEGVGIREDLLKGLRAQTTSSSSRKDCFPGTTTPDSSTPALLNSRPCRSPYLSTHPQHVPCPLPMIHSFPRLPALNMPTGRQKGRPSRGSLAPPPIPQEKGRWCWTCGRIMSRFYSLLRFVSWGLRQGGGGDWSRRGGEGGGWGSWSEISLCCLRYLLCS